MRSANSEAFACPIEEPNMGRSIILSDIAREIGIPMRPADIEKVFRIGDWDPRNPRPRLVKCVFYNELKRDQVFYFKARLRFSLIFKAIKINKEEHKDLRMKSAMLRQAAILAREARRFVYQRPDSISIDGVTYTLEHNEAHQT